MSIFRKTVADNSGFSLTEVVVAMAIFAVFATVFVQTSSTQVMISSGFNEELKMRSLAQQIINDTLINTPDLSESLFVGKTEKNFENDENYRYVIQWKKFTLPDFSKLKSREEQDAEGQSAIQAQITQKVTENMERLIYQAEITIVNKETQYSHTVSAWVYNGRAVLDLSGF